MALTYSDTVSALYGDREFSVAEFSRAINSPRASRTLSELKRRGVVARVGRGRYRCLGPSEKPDLRAAEYRRVRGIARALPYRFAWTGPSAVEVWTDGRYSAPPSLALSELHIAVEATDVGPTLRYLRSHGISLGGRKRTGTVVRLHSVSKLRCVIKGHEPVVPRRAVDEFIRAHPDVFGGARAWLDDRPR